VNITGGKVKIIKRDKGKINVEDVLLFQK